MSGARRSLTEDGHKPMTPATDPSTAGREPVARGSGVTLWRQIAQKLEDDILSGRLKPGARLPVEAELAETFGVNRHTLRRALGHIAEQGLIEATAGRGTFVKEPPLRYPIGARTRFSEIVSAGGREPFGRFLGSSVEAACPDVARELAIPEGTPVLRIETAHDADGVPISFGSAWFPHARFRDLDLVYAATGSLTRALATLGIDDYRRRETRVTARPADAREMEILSLAPGRAVLVLERLDVEPSGTPLQWGRSAFAADRVQLVFQP
ncbi:phosphonate metabolism transcriptional regulator PhnF [Xanthobacter dioxanivorans]|uniref:Phosphonate metabolism transcriptional regulator PhnF n=1 Tax=Xanthobacter dioxanivorans TaxID=2528964 RepID=A0A974PQG8_9HYPH|nr:phosphonate metabolism transcriptional regulator PhnF [Xanthobacter dioxanivorans]QRG07518.1 phosphonate metabolism transcriptional regulator PhnF [Xanthobacter dioxanivorans]